MNKNHKLLLNDYLKDSSEKRLSLFISMVNSQFKLDKKSKEQVISLIEDYKLDNSKQRLNILETFIAGNKKEDGLFRPKTAKKIAAGEIKQTVEEVKETKQISEDNIKADAIRKTMMGLMRSRRPDMFNQKLEAQIDELKAELKPIEERLGCYDVVPSEKSKLDVIFGVFGHWDDPESVAYELRCGIRPKIQIRTDQDVRQAFADMVLLAQVAFRQFYLTNNALAGGTKGVKHVTIWTFVDAKSGLGPQDTNYVETNLDTGETKAITSGNAGQFSNTARPNLNNANFAGR